jgi:hypothetical protein
MLKNESSMLASEARYDVYNTPRIAPIQFGDFVAGDGAEREGLLRSAKYFRRAHRARAWFARQHIIEFLTSPLRKIGNLDAALETANSDKSNPSFSDEKRADAEASADCISMFIQHLNKIELAGREIVALPDEQFPTSVGPIGVQVDLACLLRSVDKSGADRVGGILLNTQKGKGLGQKDGTKAKRTKAGETVALLVLKRMIDEFSDIGEPRQEDAIHLYTRGGHAWRAPENYTRKLKNMEAEGRVILSLWGGIKPPSDFDPDKATFHD